MIKHISSRKYFIIVLVLLLIGCGGAVKPLADNQKIETSEDQSINFVLTGSSTATETLTYQIKLPPNFGSLSGSAPNLTYTPLAGFVGHASFTFIVNDGVTDSDEATIDIEIAPNLEGISQKPIPVFLKLGYPTSTTEIHLEWSESLDDTTPTNNIIYEIHIADNEGFYPTPETLFSTVTGVQETDLSGFSAGELVYAKIIAVDASGNRSLETNALPVTVAKQELATRDDINIFLADEHLENPELDVENSILSFTQIDNELPDVGDYILFNTQVDTAIFRITGVLNPAAKSAFLPNASPTLLGAVEFEVAAADFGELMQSGDLNLSIGASNGSDAGSRWKEGWDWTSLTYGELDLKDDLKFDCADSAGRNTKVNLLESPPAGITNYAAGVEIGCVVTIEIKNTFTINPLGAIPNACNLTGTDFAVVKHGSIRAKGNMSLSPFINMGVSVPISLPSKTVWKKAKPIEKSFIRKINVRGFQVPIKLTVQVRPKVDWKFEVKTGTSVEFATNSLIEGTFDSQVEYSRAFYSSVPCVPDLAGYAFEFTNNDEPELIPQTGALVVKSTVAGEIEIVNNFLWGVGVNLKHLDRVSVTTGLNTALVAKGAIELRDSQLIEKFGASFLEVRSLELIAETSIKASGSAKLLDIDLPWLLKPLELLYSQKVDLIDRPLSDFTLWRTPHLDLTATEMDDESYQLAVKGRDDDGVLVDVLKTDVLQDELNWLSHNTNDGFTLTPDAGDGIGATGTFITPPTESFSVALSYLPPIANLLEKIEASGDAYRAILTKYATTEVDVASDLIVDVEFEDEHFRSCVLDTASDHKWVYVNEVTSLLCYASLVNNSLGIERFTALADLRLENNQLTNIDLSKNIALTELHLDNNHLTSIDLSNNTALVGLSLNNNQLTNIDLSNNTALARLHLDNNQLTSITLNNNTALENLIIRQNQLTSIDISNSTALNILYLSENQLTSIDVSNSTVLNMFNISDNQLTSINLSNNTALSFLYISRNPLTQVAIDYLQSLGIDTLSL